MSVPVEAVEVVARLTLALVELRQNECKHLLVENLAVDLFNDLLGCLRITYAEDK